MINREKKEDIIKGLRVCLETAQAVVIAENTGLTAVEMGNLRRRVRDCNAVAQVVKNTLVKISITDTPFEPLSEKMSGALIYGIGSDPSSMAKVFVETAKENKKLIIRGGALLTTGVIDDVAVKKLASLPGREELLTHLAVTAAAPITGFMRQLKEVPSAFVRTLAAKRDQKNGTN